MKIYAAHFVHWLLLCLSGGQKKEKYCGCATSAVPKKSKRKRWLVPVTESAGRQPAATSNFSAASPLLADLCGWWISTYWLAAIFWGVETITFFPPPKLSVISSTWTFSALSGIFPSVSSENASPSKRKNKNENGTGCSLQTKANELSIAIYCLTDLFSPEWPSLMDGSA